MSGKRKSPLADGLLAERLYMRAGTRRTTWWYKHPDNHNEILASAPSCRPDLLAQAKAQALQRWADQRGQAMPGKTPAADASVAALFERYFAWQEALPGSSTLRKADSTLRENRRESVRLLAVFGAMLPQLIKTQHVYAYIDARTQAGAPSGCIKEVAMLSAVLSYGQRIGRLDANPCHGIRHEVRPPRTRVVSWAEIEHASAVGRRLGGTAHLQALALRTAWLAFKRPGEVLHVPRTAVTDEGLCFESNKRRRSQGRAQVIIAWSPELRATVDEALGLQRWAAFGGARLIFGNLAGHAYSKSGWGSLLGRFMAHCEAEATALGVAFSRFTLADCRPGGITSKMSRGERDVYDGTGHADKRMVDQVYDRRRVKQSTPAG